MNKKFTVWFSVLVGLVFAALASPALAQGDPSWNIAFDEQVEHVFNANRASLAQDEVDETQITSVVRVQADYGEGKRLSTNLSYRLDETYYSEDTQESDPRLIGRAELVLGAPIDPAELTFYHEKLQLLRDSAAPDVTNNREDRTTVGTGLRLQSNPLKADFVTMNLGYEESKFEESELNDTNRKSVELRYQRDVSEITSVGISLGASQVDYVNFQPANYDLVVTYGFFSRTLRNTQYFLALGHNTVTAEDGTESNSPYVELNVSRFWSATQFTLGLSNTVRDNSNVGGSPFADGNTDGIGPIGDSPPEDEESINGGNLDLLESFTRSNAFLSLSNRALCRRCTARARAEFTADKYDGQPLSDERFSRVSLGFVYRLSTRSDIAFSVSQTDREFINQEDDGNYVENFVGVDWFKSFGKHWRLSLYARGEERNFIGDGSYAMQYYGIGLRYTQN